MGTVGVSLELGLLCRGRLILEQTSAADYAGKEYNVKETTALLAFTSMLVLFLPVLFYFLSNQFERHNSDLVLFF